LARGQAATDILRTLNETITHIAVVIPTMVTVQLCGEIIVVFVDSVILDKVTNRDKENHCFRIHQKLYYFKLKSFDMKNVRY
jgi:hypothetical protein